MLNITIKFLVTCGPGGQGRYDAPYTHACARHLLKIELEGSAMRKFIVATLMRAYFGRDAHSSSAGVTPPSTYSHLRSNVHRQPRMSAQSSI